MKTHSLLVGLGRLVAGVAGLLGFVTSNSVTAAPPPNDTFAAATVMTGKYWLTAGTLYGASSEGNEPILTGFPNGPTAWWRWQAPRAGLVRIRTWGSENENLLGLYRGARLETTRLVSYGTSHADRAHSAEVTFFATAGETYSIQVLGADYANPVFITDPFLPSRVQLSLIYASVDESPLNDRFANAQRIEGSVADVTVNITGASNEPGEPVDQPDALGNTVWLTWTAPFSGAWQLDSQQGDFDSIVSVYVDEAVDQLTRLDFADSDSSFTGDPFVGGGRLNFTAIGGRRYHFQVQGAALAGAAMQHGNVRLRLQPVEAPDNDDFSQAFVLTGPEPTAEGWTTFATREPGEPKSRVDEGPSIWWRWTAPASGLLAVIEYQGIVNAYVGSALDNLKIPTRAPNAGSRGSRGGVTDWYSVTAGTTIWLRGAGERVTFSLRLGQPPANDDFADRKPVTGQLVEEEVDLENSSWEQEEPQTSGFGPPTVWYRWTAPTTQRYLVTTEGSPSFTRVWAFTGNALTNLTRVGEEIIGKTAPVAYGRIFLEAVAGQEYQIQLRRESIVHGIDRLNIRPATPPPNDDFTKATVVTGNSWSVVASNLDATADDRDPLPLLNGGGSGATVWWRWTAPSTGLFRASTVGSEIDTILDVFTGASPESLTRVAEDQDSGWAGTGAFLFRAEAGTTYHFLVDGQGREEGRVTLSLAALTSPPNDAFANRLRLGGRTALAGGRLAGATVEAGEPAVPGAQGGHSVWYEWTSPANGTAYFKVTAARFDPAFGLYRGTSLGSLQANVTGGSGASATSARTFLVAYPVTQGGSYQIRIDGSPADTGDFQVSVTLPTAPTNDAFETRTPLSGSVVHTSANNDGATSQVGEPAHAGGTAQFSVWWDWTAPETGPVAIDTVGSTAQARLAVYTGSTLNTLTPVANGALAFPSTVATAAFQATAGTHYVIAADSGSRSQGEIALNVVSRSAAPTNDAFASATVWRGDQAETLVRPLATSAETGEPAHGGRPAAHSLWWAWTPQTTRRALLWLETEQESLRARLAVYRGDQLTRLIPQAAMTGDVHWSRLEVDVLAGETYYLAVDTLTDSVDPGWLRLGVVPVNGTRANAIPISPSDGPVPAILEGASNEDPALSPTSVRQLWWTWVPEFNTRMEWRVDGVFPDELDLSVGSPGAFFGSIANATQGRRVPGTGTVTGTFEAVAGNTYFLKAMVRRPQAVSVQLTEVSRPVPPPNNERYLAQPMTGASWRVPITLGAESGERLYWNWTAPFAGVAQLELTGTLAADDALYAYADGTLKFTAGARHSNGGPPVLRLQSDEGQQWTIVTESHLRRLRPAVLSLVSPAPGTSPANDSWTQAGLLDSSWSRIAGDVTSASCEPGEPDHSSSGGTRVATQLPPGRSVWYTWTPTRNGTEIFRLESAIPLALQLYRGRTPAEWQVEAFLQPGARALPVYLIAGQTYYLAVATRPYDEQTSSFVLHRGAAAPNDSLAAAGLLTGARASGSADSAGASVETGEPGHGFNFERPRGSLWWRWTAPTTGLVWADTLGSEFETILAVFDSNLPDETARVAENKNATSTPGINVSAVVFTANQGASYLFRICHGDTREPAGLARLNLTMTAPGDPYGRWVADHPTLAGGNTAENADADGDGLSNLAELAFGGDPSAPDSQRGALRLEAVPGGMSVEARLDRNSLEALHGGTSLSAQWEVSQDLVHWQPGPPSGFRRHDGRFSIEGIVLTPNDPPFARLSLRRPR